MRASPLRRIYALAPLSAWSASRFPPFVSSVWPPRPVTTLPRTGRCSSRTQRPLRYTATRDRGLFLLGSWGRRIGGHSRRVFWRNLLRRSGRRLCRRRLGWSGLCGRRLWLVASARARSQPERFLWEQVRLELAQVPSWSSPGPVARKSIPSPVNLAKTRSRIRRQVA